MYVFGYDIGSSSVKASLVEAATGHVVAVALAAQWAANFLISSTYPPMMEFSGAFTYGFYCLMAALSALFVWKMGPETKGRTLEQQMEGLWKNRRLL